IGSGEADQEQYNHPKYVHACGGFGFLAKREIFSKNLWFDEIFNPYGWEDVDLSLRARKGGYKILYVPKALISHKGGRVGRGGALPEFEKYKVRNFFILMKRHTNLLQWMCFVCLIPAKAIYFIIEAAYNRNSKVLLAQLRGFLDLLSKN
ncbi:MAG: glycosyltransferase family 2 protein, partial [Thermodesulfobacteriota bacterium]